MFRSVLKLISFRTGIFFVSERNAFRMGAKWFPSGIWENLNLLQGEIAEAKYKRLPGVRYIAVMLLRTHTSFCNRVARMALYLCPQKPVSQILHLCTHTPDLHVLVLVVANR